MRNIFTIVFIGLIMAMQGQTPALVNYQGVARDGSGSPIVNQTISLKFEIRQGSATGSVIYTDTHTGSVQTNSLGLFNTVIGENSPLTAVQWGGGPYYLEVSVDAAGGTSFISLGTQQVVSVPFAMHAQTVPS